jgi:hypothetical protein
LILVRAFEYEFAVERPHHARSYGNYFLYLFLLSGQRNQLGIGNNRDWGGGALGGHDRRHSGHLHGLHDGRDIETEILNALFSVFQEHRFFGSFEARALDRNRVVSRLQIVEFVVSILVGFGGRRNAYGWNRGELYGSSRQYVTILCSDCAFQRGARTVRGVGRLLGKRDKRREEKEKCARQWQQPSPRPSRNAIAVVPKLCEAPDIRRLIHSLGSTRKSG